MTDDIHNQVNCPSCGYNLDVQGGFVHLVVCPSCSSAVILDEAATRIAGKMAVLAQTPSPFFIGASGTIRGHGFSVLGRYRYGWEQGYWDEWFLQLEDGTTAWVSEDADDLVFERCTEAEEISIPYEQIQPGDWIPIGETPFHVDEKDIAVCEGGEGQLPHAVISGERVPFVDLSAEGEIASIEFEEEGARIFRGQRLELSEITVDVSGFGAGAGGDTLAVTPADAAHTRERVVRSRDRMLSLKCYNCGFPLDVPETGAETLTCPSCDSLIDLSLRPIECPNCAGYSMVHGGESARTLVCAHCQTQLDITTDEPSAIASLVNLQRPELPVKLGDAFDFRGEEYRVVGHLRYQETDEDGVYNTDEFMLHSKEVGYRWLVMYNGHFSFAEELPSVPPVDARRLTRGQKFEYAGTRWACYEANPGLCRISWVEGELPWVAKVGDSLAYADSISPPFMLSAEWTPTEMEWYRSEYLQPAEVAQALGKPLESLPRRYGVGGNQPYLISAFRQQAPKILAMFALFNLVLGLYAWLGSGREVAKFTVQAAEYAQPYLSQSFQVSRDNSVLKAIFHAPVSNSWVYLDAAVVNAEDAAELDISAQMSYYSGVEGGESWSEGSRSSAATFRLKKAGEYSLLLQGQGGSGNSSGSPGAGQPVTVRILEGVKVPTLHFLLAFFIFAWAMMEWILRGSFEARRWAETAEDEDD